MAGDKKRALIEYLGQEAWDVLDVGLQDKMCQVVEWACHDHVRALFAKWGAKFEMKELSPLLEESIEELASCLRIDGKVSSLNYQSSKLLQGGRDAVHYNQAIAFHGFMVEHFPCVVVPKLLRKVGSRFDGEVETAFHLYWLRIYLMKFVTHRLVGAKEGEGGRVLESAVFVQCTIIEVAAAQRARAIFFDKFGEPVRWLQDSKKTGLRQLDMVALYALLVKFAERLQVDATFCMDGTELLPELAAAYPALAAHERERAARL